MRLTNSTTKSIRRGFTLLELLIVVSIIIALTALSVTVMNGIADQANEAATISTIRKIDGLLSKRIEAFNRAFDRRGPFQDRYLTAARNLLAHDRIYGPLRNDPRAGEGADPVVEILAKKVAMRHNFPQRHEDLLLLGFDLSGAISVTDIDPMNMPLPSADRTIDRGYFDASGTFVTMNGNRIADVVEKTAVDRSKLPKVDEWVDDSTVSAELLYYFLVHSASLGVSDAITDQFEASEIADTDDDGLLEFVDAWGNPLRFYRWPTRMIDVNPPTIFQPVLSDLSEATDVDPSPDNNPTNDGDRGREVTLDERLVANILVKGLPPSPRALPNGAISRDLLLLDPDDPVGVLYRALEQYTGGAVDLNGDGDTMDPGENDTGVPFRAEFNEINYHTPDTYHSPLIVSSGSDQELGLFEPSNTARFGNLAAYDNTVAFATMLERLGDNLTNRNRRAGARR